MKQDNKKLYESIMASVAKEVKKALNETVDDTDEEDTLLINGCIDTIRQDLHRFGNIELQYSKCINTKNFYQIISVIADNLELSKSICDQLALLAKINSAYRLNLCTDGFVKQILENTNKRLPELKTLMGELYKAIQPHNYIKKQGPLGPVKPRELN